MRKELAEMQKAVGLQTGWKPSTFRKKQHLQNSQNCPGYGSEVTSQSDLKTKEPCKAKGFSKQFAHTPTVGHHL